ncbi:MAG: class I SAM-dependent methyltransferase [Bacteroidota bacterium]
MQHTQCYLCTSKNISPLVGFEKHQLGKCSNCDFVFMLRIPTTEELVIHYKKYSYGDVNAKAKLSPLTVESFNRLLDYFEKYRKNNTLLDVGCGRGYLLEIAKNRGWKVYGTEFSEEAVDICERKGITMHQGVLSLDVFKNIEFDVIVSLEVIEHINNPNQELEIINSKLRKGGLFYITTPNFNGYLRYQLKSAYNVIEYPEHLSYYTKTTLNRVLNKNGFKKIKMEATGVSITRKEQSKKTTQATENPPPPTISSDEKLREVMTKNKLMVFTKQFVNKLLSITGLGLTLKGYYTK